jgi:hypothetical protein
VHQHEQLEGDVPLYPFLAEEAEQCVPMDCSLECGGAVEARDFEAEYRGLSGTAAPAERHSLHENTRGDRAVLQHRAPVHPGCVQYGHGLNGGAPHARRTTGTGPSYSAPSPNQEVLPAHGAADDDAWGSEAGHPVDGCLAHAHAAAVPEDVAEGGSGWGCSGHADSGVEGAQEQGYESDDCCVVLAPSVPAGRPPSCMFDCACT